MADETFPEGITIRYQNKLCGPIFEYSRPNGLEPGFGTIFVSIDEFKAYRIVESISGVDQPPLPGVTQEKQATNLVGFQSSGDLEFVEVEPGNAQPHRVTINKVILTERAVESAFAFDDESDLCRVEISDFRYLWGKRGIVTTWVNIPRNGAGLPLEALQDAAPGRGRAPLSKEAQAAAAKAGSAGSTVGADSQKQLAINQLLDEMSIASLAKAPQFGSPGEALVSQKLIPTNVDPAKVALMPSGVGPDTIWPKGQGPSTVSPSTGGPQTTGLGAEVFIPGSTNGGTPWTLKQTLEQKVLPFLPGSPKLNRMPSDLEAALPIGHAWDGVFAKQALKDLIDEFQLILSLDLDGNVSLWKRDEGPSQEGAEKLLFGVRGPDAFPITVNPKLDGCDPRVASGKKVVTFRWVPTIVVVQGPPIIVTEHILLESVGEISGTVLPINQALEAIGLTMDRAQAYALSRYSDKTALPWGITVDGVREFDRWAFKWFRIPGGAEQNPDKLPILNGRGSTTIAGALKPVKVFSESHMIVNVMATKLAALQASLAGRQAGPSGTTGGAGSQINKAAAEAARELLKAAGPESYLVTHNLPFSEQTDGFEIDHERGIVKFHSPQGHCVADGVELDTFKALLSSFAAVELEFCRTLKPSFNDDMSTDHRYTSVWQRGPGGVATPLGQVPPGSAPAKIERHELQEIRGANGETNRALLDTISKKLAENMFKVPQVQPGMIVTFCRPVPIVGSGQALSVRWFTDNERPRVEVHVNTFAPMSPDQELRTRAFGVGAVRGIESVIAPRGLTR